MYNNTFVTTASDTKISEMRNECTDTVLNKNFNVIE